ncbi:AMP-binding protein [Streptomyces sp. NPDC048018]|uniref:AMP-binding protein n=1 Tax=Streptomyces sp. NPDC048018 TaxID=3365499 RepID=UPI0037184B44
MTPQPPPSVRFACATDENDNLRGYLLAAAATTPDAPALVERAPGGGLRTFTYAQLEGLVDDYVAALDRLGLDVGERVVVQSHHCSSAVAVLLACATLGLPFIPVAPDMPDERLALIVDSAGPALFLQHGGGTRDALPDTVGTGRFGDEGLSIERAPRTGPRIRGGVTPTDPVYIIFTSGTTGRPKGVVMTHRGVLAFLRGVRRLGFVAPGDRVATTSPLQFDFSLVDTGMALGCGATIVPVPREELGWPRRFLDFLTEAGVGQVHGVPSIWRPVLRTAPAELAAMSSLRRIVYSGEEFPLPEMRRLSELLPQAQIVNGYGATESMAASLTAVPTPLPDTLERPSIGWAHPGAEMALVGPDGRAVTEPGRTGEIYLRSPALFSGYWNDPEATAAALVPDPFDPASGQIVFRTGDLAYRGPEGELYFCGRVDSQVQVRGNRVELGEIERRLQQHEGVASAVVVLDERGGAEPVLSAFLVREDGAAGRGATAATVRAFCAAALPSYMLPQSVHFVGDIPLTSNGKADRRALLAGVTR